MMGLLERWVKGSLPRWWRVPEIIYANNPGRPNILIFTENINATYFISFDIPLKNMHSRGELNFAVVSQQSMLAQGAGYWEKLNADFRPDLVIMTRYGLPYGSEILSFYQRSGIPVIYHIDDDLLEIPHALGSEIVKRQGAAIEARRQMLANCDLIYASTEYLSRLLSSRFPQQKIFHGIYASFVDVAPKDIKRAKRSYPVIGYMGSKGHQEDLQIVVPVLVSLLQEHHDLHFETFGTIAMPTELGRFQGRVKSHSVQKSYRDFLQALACLGWDIGLAPLADTTFNQCKAPTKFIEYTSCGIPVAATHIGLYAAAMPEDAGMLVQNHQWHETLSTMLNSSELREKLLSQAREHCKNAYSIFKLEQQIKDVLVQFNIME